MFVFPVLPVSAVDKQVCHIQLQESANHAHACTDCLLLKRDIIWIFPTICIFPTKSKKKIYSQTSTKCQIDVKALCFSSFTKVTLEHS